MADNLDRYTGTILKDRFVLEDLIGSGGMAIVYRATDRVTGNTVAVKILKEEFVKDEQFRRRFLNESRAISMISHRNIVSVIDFDFEGNLQYIVMEYVDGITLKDFMRARKVISPVIAIKIAKQTLLALQHAHDRGIIHRDIKPQNIMILKNGTIKVMDFGIARINKFETITMTDKAIGTVYYISPEQARGEQTDPRSDLYSVGVMLYEMLTGEMPFDGDTPVSVALKQIQSAAKKPRSINRAIPEGLEQIVMRAMMKTPDKRFNSAIDMIRDLELIQQDETTLFDYDLTEELPSDSGDIALSNTKKKEKSNFWTKNNIIALAAGGGSALLIIGIILVLFLTGGFGGGSSSSVTVPNFIGNVYNEIVADINMAANFKFVSVQEFNPDVSAGTVFEQSVEAGTSVKPGTEVVLKVSKGSEMITVPEFTDTTSETDATDALEALNIKYTIIRQNNEDVDEGFVIKTTPEAGKEIEKDATLYLYISSGSGVVKVKVPNCVGKLLADARILLGDSGFTVDVHEEPNSVYNKGYVFRQFPNADEEYAEGKTVILFVSTGNNEEPAPEPEPEPEPQNPDEQLLPA